MADYKRMWMMRKTALIAAIEKGNEVGKGEYDSSTYHFVVAGERARDELLEMNKIEALEFKREEKSYESDAV